MTDPLGSGIVGLSRSAKELDFGWARAGEDQEQFYQRLTRNLRQIDAQLQNQFAPNPARFLGLKFAYFGGVLDTGDWTVIPDGDLVLPNNATSYVERSDSGTVRAVAVGFTYPDWIPMAQVRTRAGEISDVLDRRPELGGAPSGSAGLVTFSQILGTILNVQVPLSAVSQWQAFLTILSTQIPEPWTVDTINERTLDAGVTIEGVLLKDGEIEVAKKALRLDDTGVTPKLLYLGKAAPGSAEGSAVWAIQRITFASDGDADVEWADGNGNEDNIWTNRLAISYS
ncbi:MAG: hypothetical protein OEO20_11525 [Gemmatimonadota bacterium]|nr:hypothetical protein [Gemmatimonadota bacterium]MDH3366535.1 hypothetical protein [Gemmatimonadota bacterium]MDH3478924.1 hypothetical protein [Gemmatimonadota bacterium]MDH3570617.1 hypothetical protein [Gemmatimonadota bacterium]